MISRFTRYLKTIPFLSILLFLCLFSQPSFALAPGLYLCVSTPGLKLDISSEGDYDLWIEKGNQIIEVQLGTYTEKNGQILFTPERSDVGDLEPIKAKIVDECTLDLENGGIFRRESCAAIARPAKKQPKASNLHNSFATDNRKKSTEKGIAHFPKKWHVVKKAGLAIYIPADAKIVVNKRGVTIQLDNARGGLIKKKNLDISSITARCKAEKILSKNQNKIYVCSPESEYRFIQLLNVSPKDDVALVAYIKANDPASMKALSIALSSARPLEKRGSKTKSLRFKTWTPSDRSFTIDVPSGWEAHGGTADFGRNGYIRIIQAISPQKDAGFLGVYYPFYQYAQTAYGSNGIPPMEPENYIKTKFFKDLETNYNIIYDNLNIVNIHTDNELSKQATNAYQRVAGPAIFKSYKAVNGKGTFTYQGNSYEMAIFGFISYLKQPMAGLGYMDIWGPEPLFVVSCLEGKLPEWKLIFEHMAESWQVNNAWLSQHLQRASMDAKRSLEHFSRMRKLIHENAEKRMNESLEEWESEEQERNEEFWDTFFALGGEERYDDPVTGEEVDVPTGADKYLYDHLSDIWVGIKMDNPDAQDIVQYLKEKGFRELRPHVH